MLVYPMYSHIKMKNIDICLSVCIISSYSQKPICTSTPQEDMYDEDPLRGFEGNDPDYIPSLLSMEAASVELVKI